MLRLSIVIPVLNEIDNLPVLAKRLSMVNMNCEFIFVDDGSSDGTRELLSELSQKDSKFKFVFNECRIGHMGSYLKGLEKASSTCVVIMDGDLQHPPESLEGIAKCLENGYDIVVASRYDGRFFIGNRDKTRGIISRGAEFLLKALVKECRGISDPISGFIGFRKSLIIPITSNMKGNKLLPFLIMANREAKIGYVHYSFSERTAGTSKIVSSRNNFILKYMLEIGEIRRVKRQLVRNMRFDSSHEQVNSKK